MRTFLVISFAILLAGCTHGPKSYVGHIRDIQKLEELCDLLREEITLMKHSLSRMESENTPARLGDLARQRREAAAQARDTYSHGNRVRDLQDMARILERQAESMRAEFHAYHDGKIIDIFE